MRTVLLALIILLLAAQASAEAFLNGSVSVPAADLTVRLEQRASALRMKVATVGIEWRGYQIVRDSNGQVSSIIPVVPIKQQVPAFVADNTTIPASSDTTLVLDSESVSAWNVYNNIAVDIICFTNTTGGAIVVEVEAWY